MMIAFQCLESLIAANPEFLRAFSSLFQIRRLVRLISLDSSVVLIMHVSLILPSAVRKKCFNNVGQMIQFKQIYVNSELMAILLLCGPLW